MPSGSELRSLHPGYAPLTADLKQLYFFSLHHMKQLKMYVQPLIRRSRSPETLILNFFKKSITEHHPYYLSVDALKY